MPWPKGKPHSKEQIIKRVKSFKANGAKRKRAKMIDGVEHWKCPTCGGYFNAEGFHKSKRTPNGITSQCRRCHNRASIKTRDLDNARDSNKEYMRRARRKAPDKFRERERVAARRKRSDPAEKEKILARGLLNAALRRGEIRRPNRCENCGWERPIQAHHPDYSKPLFVHWLCSDCHGVTHRKHR